PREEGSKGADHERDINDHGVGFYSPVSFLRPAMNWARRLRASPLRDCSRVRKRSNWVSSSQSSCHPASRSRASSTPAVKPHSTIPETSKAGPDQPPKPSLKR